jgi:phage terminase large subunit-like protein
VFPPEDDEGKWLVLPRFWIPKDTMLKKVQTDRVPYDKWAEDNFIKLTDGNVVNYNAVQKQIIDDCGEFNVVELAIDRWNATQLSTNLMDNEVPVVAFGQGFASMSAPTKEMEKLVLEQKLAHADNPILRWMATNTAVKQDPAGNIKPAKDKSTGRIDGIVALIMAIGRATQGHDENSVYEERGITTF